MRLHTGFRDASIRGKLVMLMLLTALTCMLIAAPAWTAYSWRSVRALVVEDLNTTSQVIAANSTAALSFGDVSAATESLSALRAKPDVLGACLYRMESGTPRLFARYAGNHDTCPDDIEMTVGNDIVSVVPVLLSNERIGTLRIVQSLQPLHEALRAQIGVTILVLAISFAVSLLLALRMQKIITEPISRLAQAARRVSETKDYALRVDVAGHDELSRLSSDFNNMMEVIASADSEVRRARAELADEVERKTAANAELEVAMERLRMTQAQLVQSEKMASLGALVAGVAHEINTPVGVGVTAASTLQAKATDIKLKYEKNDLTREDLEAFLGIANEFGEIILSNLMRAADLIQSFKRVAVDQTSNERREFNLNGYIGEVLQSLGPKLKRAGHSVHATCPETLTLDSYPGVLAQILTNFVGNSLLHAFDAGQSGQLYIDARQDGEEVVIRYSDDGKGISSEYLPRIFDPFFTTKRGAGGTGLGLHIVYNLVTQTLGGSISAESAPGKGFAITARFPQVAKGASS